MKLVETTEQILANVATLEAVRSGQRAGRAADYRSLIKRGTCFLPYPTSEGIAFAPSRFIGYIANSFARHATNDARDGRQTNRAINTTLGQTPALNPILEEEYRRFCLQLGFSPLLTGTFGVTRKYWITQDILNYLELIMEKGVIDDPSLSTTQKDQIIKARVGQGAFRDALVAFWNAQCCVTKCAIAPVLRASHIKPWSVSSNGERLDKFNGLLLTANIDALFDRGLISFSDTGEILRAAEMSEEQLKALGCDPAGKIRLKPRHLPFLAYHRAEIFGRRSQL
ncbi:HNH endonuclease [Neorhizobium galegae]|uniref:HNH endonuclease n=1 Tax=Neorhizobium galegae TaxID=399 RepID=UPI0021010F51|nr:HNH endonuclease signature motif containing protein [Neorhizobium galegae]MCQ1573483.1 HNH endonuclease [Neorhizobium galegae]